MKKQYTVTIDTVQAIAALGCAVLFLLLLYACHRWQLAEEKLAANPGRIIVTKAVLEPIPTEAQP